MLKNYNDYNDIMDKYIPSNFIRSTIKKLADSPERLIGVLHANTFELGSITSFGISRNNSFGNAIESVFRKIVKTNGWIEKPTEYILSNYKLKTIIPKNKKKLAIDQVFSYDNTVVFIEQKIRDDHDTSKWPGQWNNFELKLRVLTEIYNSQKVIGVMWMIDDNFHRNKDNYQDKINSLNKKLKDKAILCYGKEIDDIFNNVDGKNHVYFNEFLSFLTNWHNTNIKIPDLNFDKFPYDSISVFDELNTKEAKNFFGNKDIINYVFPIIFPNGQTLKLYQKMLNEKTKHSEKENCIMPLIEEIIKKY